MAVSVWFEVAVFPPVLCDATAVRVVAIDAPNVPRTSARLAAKQRAERRTSGQPPASRPGPSATLPPRPVP